MKPSISVKTWENPKGNHWDEAFNTCEKLENSKGNHWDEDFNTWDVLMYLSKPEKMQGEIIGMETLG